MRKLIVVTGGSKGIGRAIVERFAREQFDVATCARHEEDLDNLRTALAEKYGTKAFTFVADVGQRADVAKFTSFVENLQRPVDVLVNNAGYFATGAVASEPEGLLEHMMSANVFSAYHITRGLLSAIAKANSAHVFNMCSIASIKAYPNGASYAMTKFALLGFSKVLREELKQQGIRVTAVMPGATLTDSWAGVDLPQERFMTAEDVADTVYGTYALSPRSVVEEIIIRPQLGDI